MTAITGAQINAGLALNATTDAWGTAKATGAGNGIRAEIAPSIDVQQLSLRPIGGGAIMTPDSYAGRQTPVVNLTADLGFQNGTDRLLAQFFGYSPTPSEVTGGQGDYRHQMLLSETANQVYTTFAYEDTTTTTIELPTASVRSITLSFSETHAIINLEAELLGSKVEISSAVNTNAVLAGCTIPDSEPTIIKLEDKFWINAESGDALDSGDQYDIVSYTLVLTRPQDFIGNVKGSAGNAAPQINDVTSGTLTVTVQQVADHTYHAAWAAGTKYKCKLTSLGSVIAAGTNKEVSIFVPSMKLVSFPDHQQTEAGFNSMTLEFTIFAATAAPTGMASIYPYVEIVNTRTTAYVA